MSGFSFDEFLASEGDAPTQHNSGFDFDSFIQQETGQTPWGKVAQKIPDALKAINPITVGTSIVKAPMDPKVQKAITPWLPAIGGTLGTPFAPVTGGMSIPIGAGLGTVAKQAVEVAQGNPDAPITPWAAAKDAMTQTVLAGAPEASGVFKAVPGAATYGERATQYAASKLKDAAVGSTRRALGFTKRFLSKPGQLEKANQAAETLLDAGAIKPFSGAGATLERVENIAEGASSAIGQTITGLDKAGLPSLDTNLVAKEISSQLSPRYTGGAYDAEKKVVDEIVDTVRAHGDGPLTFESAQALKNKLQDLGKFQSGVDNVRTDLYRRASGIVRDALDKAVSSGSVSELGGELAPGAESLIANYQQNKKLLGAANEAVRGLSNRLGSEEGNRIISGTDFVGMAGTAAREDIPLRELPEKLGLLIAAKRGIERYGATTAASSYNAMSKLLSAYSGPVNVARRALISRLVTKEGSVETGGTK